MKAVLLGSALALLTGCASSHAIEPTIASTTTNFASAEVVDVQLSNFAFAPRTIQLEAGKPYALHLVNTASGGHDFAAPDFFAAARIAASDAEAVRDGEVELKGGQSATIHLVPGTGTFDLVCTHTGHALLGMKGEIVVR